MARMLGYCQRSWCPSCRNKGFGQDCPDVARSKHSQRSREKRALRRAIGEEVAQLVEDDPSGDDFAPFAAESLEWARLTFPAGAESWPEYADPAVSGWESR